MTTPFAPALCPQPGLGVPPAVDPASTAGTFAPLRPPSDVSGRQPLSPQAERHGLGAES